MAVMNARENLGFESGIRLDSAPLNGLVEAILQASPNIHAMRDATREGLGAILAEMAEQSQCVITVHEAAIPIRDEVRGFCEILGLDSLFLANEGKMVVFCDAADAEKVLAAMQSREYGKDAVMIGSVQEKSRGRFILRSAIGGDRDVDKPSGELVPRIC